MSKQSFEISHEVLTLCDKAAAPQGTTVIQSMVREASKSRHERLKFRLDLGEDSPLAALAMTLECDRDSETSLSSHPVSLLLISGEHLHPMSSLVSRYHGLSDSNIPPILFGKGETPKRELSLLSSRASVVIMTPERCIDHIRRGNLDCSSVQSLGILYPTELKGFELIESFDNDLMFIHSKCLRLRTVRIFFSGEKQTGSFEQYCGNFETISRQERSLRSEVIFCRLDGLEPSRIFGYIAARDLKNVLIIVPDEQRADLLTTGGDDLDPSQILRVTSPNDTDRIPTIAEHIIHVGPSEASLLQEDPSPSDLFTSGTHHILYTSMSLQTIKHIEENVTMSTHVQQPEEQEILAGKIRQLIETIEKDSEPETLNALKKLIKKQVPFYRRGYLTAFLLREYLARGSKRGARNRPARPASTQETNTDAATLFFGIGKNRRTYAKDLTRLMTEQAGISQEQVISIKSLENYSFVQVDKECAQKVIDALNGTDYKGRSLTVNFARSKGN